MTWQGLTIRTERSETTRHRDPLAGVHKHHGFPTYLGGAYRQRLVRLPGYLHYLYHEELDRDLRLPRGRRSRYYRQLSGPQMLGILTRVVRHAREFDNRYRNEPGYRPILPALRRGIRQARPLAGRRWPNSPGLPLLPTRPRGIRQAQPLAGRRLLRSPSPPRRQREAFSQSLLQYGSQGPAVQELQHWLNQWLRRTGRPILVVDGIFGSRVESAVRAFQRAMSLTVDGIVGTQTRQALRAVGNGRPFPPSAPSTLRWVLPDEVREAGEGQFVRYDKPPPWDSGIHCTGSFTAGAAELRDYIRATFPGVSSIGGYSCRQNTANSAETSVHGTGRAMDIMITPSNNRANTAVGDPIANWLVRNAAAMGVQYIIWNRVQWNGSRSGRKDRDYGGPNPHIDHIHLELNRDGAERLTSWFLNRIW
jgi:peptidoglycan hydrolase-like protein with peptidoglycan-binding domain